LPEKQQSAPQIVEHDDCGALCDRLGPGFHIADRAPITGRIDLHITYAVAINNDSRGVPQVNLRQVLGERLLDL
jgi:hypothetical protein